MKLKLKHIAPYLPYQLLCLEKTVDSTPIKGELISIKKTALCYIEHPEWEYFKFSIDRIKPILRPLSDLMKQIKWEDGTYQMTDEDDFDLENTSYNTVQEYLKRHFDIFGLIDAGLAVDINSL